jgi:hypothetical protein
MLFAQGQRCDQSKRIGHFLAACAIDCALRFRRGTFDLYAAVRPSCALRQHDVQRYPRRNSRSGDLQPLAHALGEHALRRTCRVSLVADARQRRDRLSENTLS